MDALSLWQVDLAWLMDEALSDEETIESMCRALLDRPPKPVERARLRDLLESSTGDRLERFEQLNFVLRQARPAVRGIYRFQEDQLELCFAAPGEPRPTRFKIGRQGGQILLRLKPDPSTTKLGASSGNTVSP